MGLFYLVCNECYLLQLQVLDLQVSGVHFLESQTHFLEHVFIHVLPVQQLLTFVLSPAIAASDNSTTVPAIKILRFIVKKFRIYYSVN